VPRPTPDPSLNVLCVILGIYLLVGGVLAIVQTRVGFGPRAYRHFAGDPRAYRGCGRDPASEPEALWLWRSAIGLWFMVAGALDLARRYHPGPRRLPAA